jgi:hypothetical protein
VAELDNDVPNLDLLRGPAIQEICKKLRQLVESDVIVIQTHTGTTFSGKLSERKVSGESHQWLTAKWWFGIEKESATSIWFESCVVSSINGSTITIA